MPSDVSDDVTRLYEESAEAYSAIMDAEIGSSSYADTLDRLHRRIDGRSGALIDTSCGPGHMLALYAERHPDDRQLIGIDLTPRMVELAKDRLGAAAKVIQGDMRQLPSVADESVAAIVSYFAVQHVVLDDVRTTLREWHRVLIPGGQLVLAAWEGVGAIDYGNDAASVAHKHSVDALRAQLASTGFTLDRCATETVEDMGMDAVYLEASRA